MTDFFTPLLTAVPGAGLLLPLGALVLGYLLGILHFRSLEIVARRLVAGDMTAVALQVGRLAALGIVLGAFAWLGAASLIAGAAGLLIARARILARIRGAP